MIQELIAIEDSRNFTGAANGIRTIPMKDGEIARFHIELQTGTVAPVDGFVFNVALNGTKLYEDADRLTMLEGESAVSKEGLSIAVEEGDMVRFDIEELNGGTLLAPISFFITYDDGEANGDFDRILTDDGEVLVDNGNVMWD